MEQEILQAISTVGFPIVICLLMFYNNMVIIKANTKAINRLADRMKK